MVRQRGCLANRPLPIGAIVAATGLALATIGAFAVAGHPSALRRFDWAYWWVSAVHDLLHPSGAPVWEAFKRYVLSPGGGLLVLILFVIACAPRKLELGYKAGIYEGQDDLRVEFFAGRTKRAVALAVLATATVTLTLYLHIVFPGFPL